MHICKETIDAVAKIRQQLQPLEAEVAEAMIDRETLGSVDKQLEKIAELKLEATKVHLKCILDTAAVLSDEQISVLLPFWK